MLSDPTMKSCLVCNTREKLFVFPKDERLLLQWMRLLCLRSRPSSSDKICSNHFLPSDVLQTPKGYHKLKPGAVPSRNLHVVSNNHDHTYSADHKDPISETLSLLIMLAPVLLCLLPLLLLLCSSLSDLCQHSYNGNFFTYILSGGHAQLFSLV
jgi:hypothetical protein